MSPRPESSTPVSVRELHCRVGMCAESGIDSSGRFARTCMECQREQSSRQANQMHFVPLAHDRPLAVPMPCRCHSRILGNLCWGLPCVWAILSAVKAYLVHPRVPAFDTRLDVLLILSRAVPNPNSHGQATVSLPRSVGGDVQRNQDVGSSFWPPKAPHGRSFGSTVK